MLFRDVVKLISVTTTENDMGDIIETPVEREVWVQIRANKKKIYIGYFDTLEEAIKAREQAEKTT
jgi:hypothetical protein